MGNVNAWPGIYSSALSGNGMKIYQARFTDESWLGLIAQCARLPVYEPEISREDNQSLLIFFVTLVLPF